MASERTAPEHHFRTTTAVPVLQLPPRQRPAYHPAQPEVSNSVKTWQAAFLAWPSAFCLISLSILLLPKTTLQNSRQSNQHRMQLLDTLCVPPLGGICPGYLGGIHPTGFVPLVYRCVTHTTDQDTQHSGNNAT